MKSFLKKINLSLTVALLTLSCAKIDPNNQEIDLSEEIGAAAEPFSGKTGNLTYFYNGEKVFENHTCEVFTDQTAKTVRFLIKKSENSIEYNAVRVRIPGTFNDGEIREFTYEDDLKPSRRQNEQSILISLTEAKTDDLCDDGRAPDRYELQLLIRFEEYVEIREVFQCGPQNHQLQLECRI